MRSWFKPVRILLSLVWFVPNLAIADSHCTHQILAHLMRSPPLNHGDMAVVDIGSSTVKLYIKKGSKGEIISEVHPIDLGASLGETGTINQSSYEGLKTVLKKVQSKLDEHQIYPLQTKMVATAGIRDAKNSAEIVNLLEKDGFKFKILSEEEESKYVYLAALNGKTVSPKGAVVIEVGGGSTEVVRGPNSLMVNHEKSTAIKAGSGSLGMKDPFDPLEVEKAILKTRKLFQDKKIPFTQADYGLDGFVSQSFPYRALREIHLKITGKDLFKIGLNEQTLQFYLSPKGLQVLRNASKNSAFTEYARGISAIPSKLLILSEAKSYYRLASTIQFGSKGGMKVALLAEMEAGKVSDQIRRTSGFMVQKWNRKQDKVIENLQDVLGTEELGVLEFRVKNQNSVESKLTSKWINGKLSYEEAGTGMMAKEYVGDAVGGRLTLENANNENVEKVFQQIIDGVKNKKIQITEIHNYRPIQGVPYFTEEQVRQLSLVVKESTGKNLLVKTGSKAEKQSGYTALHLNLIDASGVPVEFQIRGKKVSQLSSFEHDFYDIRQGKSVGHLDADLVQTVQKLSNDEHQLFLGYIHDCYVYARNLELNKTAVMPKLPAQLSKYPNLGLEKVF